MSKNLEEQVERIHILMYGENFLNKKPLLVEGPFIPATLKKGVKDNIDLVFKSKNWTKISPEELTKKYENILKNISDSTEEIAEMTRKLKLNTEEALEQVMKKIDEMNLTKKTYQLEIENCQKLITETFEEIKTIIKTDVETLGLKVSDEDLEFSKIIENGEPELLAERVSFFLDQFPTRESYLEYYKNIFKKVFPDDFLPKLLDETNDKKFKELFEEFKRLFNEKVGNVNNMDYIWKTGDEVSEETVQTTTPKIGKKGKNYGLKLVPKELIINTIQKLLNENLAENFKNYFNTVDDIVKKQLQDGLSTLKNKLKLKEVTELENNIPTTLDDINKTNWLKSYNNSSFGLIFGKSNTYEEALEKFNQNKNIFLNGENYYPKSKLYVSIDGVKLMSLEEIEQYFLNEYKILFKQGEDGLPVYSPLNKLDTNWTDGPQALLKFLKENFPDLAKKLDDLSTKMDNAATDDEIKILQKEYDEVFLTLKTKLDNIGSDPVLKTKIENFVKNMFEKSDEFTTNILKNSDAGQKAENQVIKFLEELKAKFNYISSNGDPIDRLLNIDTIVSDLPTFGKGPFTLQVKKVESIIEGKWIFENGQRKFVEEVGGGTLKIKAGPKISIAKESQIDLVGFATPEGKVVIAGKQKTVAFEKVGNTKLPMKDSLGNPIFGKESLPSSDAFFGVFYIDKTTSKLVNF